MGGQLPRPVEDSLIANKILKIKSGDDIDT